MKTPLARLNYHHLHYFWAVAKEGHLSRAALRLNIAPSALSTQIRQLEEQLGQRLFSRQGRTLVLTEAGRIALEYADTIMTAGQELVATLREGRRQERKVLRLGAVATLSRNFQHTFVAPLMGMTGVELVLQSGTLSELLPRLQAHTVDLVLSNRRVPEDAQNAWRCVCIARQQVSLVGPPRGKGRPFRFPADLTGVPLLLPSRDSGFRAAFDLVCERAGLMINIVAEVDDMAMLRLLARDSGAVALVPAVVVRDELHDGRLEEYCAVPNLHEEFWAVGVRRQYQHPLLRSLLDRPAAEVLAMED
jgi:LysR family transcriptional regulator, transcriptional activator of nhaA